MCLDPRSDPKRLNDRFGQRLGDVGVAHEVARLPYPPRVVSHAPNGRSSGSIMTGVVGSVGRIRLQLPPSIGTGRIEHHTRI
jgi:hypothetical protein